MGTRLMKLMTIMGGIQQNNAVKGGEREATWREDCWPGDRG
jgi:hypothetical protein